MAARWVDSDITNKQTDKPTDYYNPWPLTHLGLTILQFEFSFSIVMLDTWMSLIINSIPSPRTFPTTIANVQWACSLALLGAVDCLYWRYDQQPWILFYVWQKNVQKGKLGRHPIRFTEIGWRPNLIMYWTAVSKLREITYWFVNKEKGPGGNRTHVIRSTKPHLYH